MLNVENIKSYYKDLQDICLSLNREAISFFEEKEMAGITIEKDEDIAALLPILLHHTQWMNRLQIFLLQNKCIDQSLLEIAESVSDEYMMSTDELFNTLIARTPLYQEKILKMTGKQVAVSTLLEALHNTDYNAFVAAFEKYDVDMRNISKLLSLLDFSHLSEDDALEIAPFIQDDCLRKVKNFEKAANSSIPNDAYNEIIKLKIEWLTALILTDEDRQAPNMMELLYDVIQSYEVIARDSDSFSLKERFGVAYALWDYMAKSVVSSMVKQPMHCQDLIMSVLSPFYFRPLILQYETEYREIEERVIDYAKQYSENFSQRDAKIESSAIGVERKDTTLLPENFFSLSHNCTNTLTLKRELKDSSKLKDHPVRLFTRFLQGLVTCGHINEEDIPALAYRLTGYGEPFDDNVIVWRGDVRVLRFIVSYMTEAGEHRPKKLNPYFVNEAGEHFLVKISARVSTNIKKLPFRYLLDELYPFLMAEL